MPARTEPKWGRVWRYEGPRGVVWRIRYHDASGRRVLETLGKEPAWTRAHAEAELRRRLVDVDREGYRHPDNTTLAQFAERWLSEYLPGRNLKLTTLDNYRQSLDNHLLPALGHHTLRDLSQQPELIDRYVSAKIKSGLAPKTVVNQLLILQGMLKRAVRWRLISHNPVHDIDRPRLEQAEPHVLATDEIARLDSAYRELEEAAVEERERAWWQLAQTITFTALGTALRRGELLALRWRDIQLLDSRLHVREALVKGRFTTPKSRSSRRSIEFGPRTRDLLEAWWRQTRYRGDDELVFSHPERGTPIDPAALSRDYLKPALDRAHVIASFRPFHDLRHTALTYDAAAGNPLAYIQQRAGHSQASITERYIHAAQVQFAGAAARAEARIFGTAH